MTPYRAPLPLRFLPVVSFSKADKEAAMGPIRVGWLMGVVFTVMPLAAVVLFLITQGFVFWFMLLPVVLGTVFISTARSKGRELASMRVDVAYCPEARLARFDSQAQKLAGLPAQVVDLPIDDVRALVARETPLEGVPDLRVPRARQPRSSFALVAVTLRGEVPIAPPLITTGASFVEAARRHLDATLRDVTGRLQAVAAANGSRPL